jgi:F0F1-type ATP synthase assembly protein I
MTNSFFLFSWARGVATGALGGYIAEKKGRTQRFGFIIGFLFGLIGVLGLMLMANKPPNDKISDGSE